MHTFQGTVDDDDDDGNAGGTDAMDKSKIEHLDKQEYTHLPHAEQEFENHEQTDVSIRPLVWTLGVLVAVVLVTYAGMVGVFQVFKMMAEGSSDNPQLSNVQSAAVRQVPEGLPALQGVPAAEANPDTPAQDMIDLRKRNDLVLSGQQPMRDAKQQPGMKPGMPIERAIDEAMSRRIFKTRAASAGPAGDGQGENAGGATTAPARDAGDATAPSGEGAGGAGQSR